MLICVSGLYDYVRSMRKKYKNQIRCLDIALPGEVGLKNRVSDWYSPASLPICALLLFTKLDTGSPGNTPGSPIAQLW